MIAGVWVGIAPLAASAAFAFLPDRLNRLWIAGCAAILLGIFVGVWARVDFLSKMANDAVWATGLFSFAFLACTSSLISRRWLRWSAVSVCLGAVVLVWLVAMATVMSGPDEIRRRIVMPGGDVCEVTLWGMAFTDSGYAISIYRELPAFGVRRELAGERINESQGDADVSCQDVFAKIGGRG